MNINRLIQGKQRRLLAIIAGVFILVVGALYFLNHRASAPKEKPAGDAATAEPDLTGGSVANTFDGAGQNSVLLDAQLREKQAKEGLESMKKQFGSLEEQMKQMAQNNQTLTQLVTSLQAKLDKQPPAGAQTAAPGATPAGVRTEYRVGPPPVVPGQIDNALLDTDQWKPPVKDTSFWIPTGTFSDAITIEGADANASVRGENNLVPMQFKLKGQAHLPGNQKLGRLDNCFVTAAAYGDISSERAIVQLQRLSCIIDGKHIDQAVKGHVAFYGKNGIKGVPVMRNGKILGLAFTAGALGGLGNSVSQVGQTAVGVGATASVSGGDVARGAIGGGVSKAADKLADYYIERAEQYHPIIPIGAANRVEVVFIEGFKAEFVEDKAAAELAKKATTKVADTTTQAAGNSGLPPELVGKLGDAQTLQMDDFVTPGRQAPQQPKGAQ
ncbi:TrbI/VirB10 family protein [Erwinia typographi]|uniref:TrbI/VirB10 family protein n=1 Tax=Erwinia typographi TaxID=371042 RepID=UPI000689EDDA|nr:TrbI/VirB10 family protein [Erwinia typographi]